MTLQSFTAATVVGALAGAYASLWGMCRSSSHPAFDGRCFVSRILIGVGAAAALQSILNLSLPTPGALVLLLGLAYATEWALITAWRAFFPGEEGPGLVVPMVVGFAGVPVRAAGARIPLAIAYFIVLGLFLLALVWLDRVSFRPRSPLTGALVGVGAGVLVASWGAWKERERSGFELVTFLRTPLLTTIVAAGLAFFIDSYVQLAIASVGYQRAAVETWKTFLAYVGWRLRSGPWC